uniref:STAS domain-containing protein n=1 Tax=Acrobeloides nanus TaxID=290746 RepID=A0A914CE67_9BILA
MFAAQLHDLFGIYNLPKRFGAGNLFYRIYDIGSNLYRANYGTMAVASSSLLFLFIGKEIISPMVKKRCKMPIQLPVELVLVIITTLVTYIFDLHIQHGVGIVNKIPTGMPMPHLPEWKLIPRLLPDAVSIAVVVVAIHISLAKLFAKKLRYEINPGQELYALGLTSSLSGFFPVYPISCSLSGTMVNVEAGSKTRVVSTIFTCLFVLSIILYIGQWLETLPMCVLSAILIYALKGVFQKFSDLKVLWPLSKIDFAIWIVSFLATVFWNLTEGLLFSICFALLTTVLRTAWPRWHFLANAKGTNIYRDAERYRDVIHFDGICIFRFDAPLLFTNVENFKKSIYKSLQKWKSSEKKVAKRASKKLSAPLKLTIPLGENTCEKSSNKVELINDDDHEDVFEDIKPNLPKCGFLNRHFIVDCSGFTFVDYMGVNALKEIYGELSNENVMVYFAAAKAPVRDLFDASGFYQYVPKHNFYPTIQDAVVFARSRKEKSNIFMPKEKLLSHDPLKELLKTQPNH